MQNHDVPKNPDDVTLEVVRELGFDSTFGVDRAPTEQVFFLGPVMNGRRERGAHATTEAILDFIAYFENQVAVAREYLENDQNNKTHEWAKSSLATCEPSVEAQVVVREILRSNGLLDYSKIQDGARMVDALVYKRLFAEGRAVVATAELLVKRRSRALPTKTIPPQGSEVVCTWPTTTIKPHETMAVYLEMTSPFILEWVLMASIDGLEKLSVVDLLSGDKSLFITSGTFPAQAFGEKGRGPTFGSAVTRTGEKLTLKVANLSDDEVTFQSAAFGRCFNRYQEGLNRLATETTEGVKARTIEASNDKLAKELLARHRRDSNG